MSKQPSHSLATFLSIKYWPTWFGLGLLWGLSFMPFACKMAVGRGLGLLSYSLARERRYIAFTNISICFPELNLAEQNKLVKNSFIENGIGLIESVSSWSRNAESLRQRVKFIGLEKAEAALAEGKGLLLLGAHYSTLDLGGALLSLALPFAATYRPHNNLLFDFFIYRGRLKTCTPLDRNDLRGVYRQLKDGKILWYAPDQDYNRVGHSVFAPFFGVTASTITTPARLATVNNSPVFIIRHHRIDETQSYEVELIPLQSCYPTGDNQLDAALVNKQLEAAIRKFPAQYLWMHKRFKTHSNGKPDSPYILIKTRTKKISLEQLNQITDGAIISSGYQGKALLTLTNGYQLKKFAGIPEFPFKSKHPAKVYDYKAKLLRSQNIRSITVDNIITIKTLGLTAAIIHPLQGKPLDTLAITGAEFPIEALANLFAQLHDKGFRFNHIHLSQLIYTSTEFSIANPEDIEVMPSPISFIERFNNLLELLRKTKFSTQQKELTKHFCQLYLNASDLKHNDKFSNLLFSLTTIDSIKSDTITSDT